MLSTVAHRLRKTGWFYSQVCDHAIPNVNPFVMISAMFKVKNPYRNVSWSV